jgi:hypothetical protein
MAAAPSRRLSAASLPETSIVPNSLMGKARLAAEYGKPLLFKGADFGKTDLPLARELAP